MNRRTFLAAVAPIVSLALPATGQAQAPAGSETFKSVARTTPPTADPKPGEAPAKRPKGPTVILARDAMLSNKINQATFKDEVDVKDPEFHMTCDKLTVYLKKPKAKQGEGAPAEPAPIGTEAATAPKKEKGVKTPKEPEEANGAKDDDEGGKIDHAIAEGNVVIEMEKVDSEGNKKIYHGKAARGVFDTNKNTCVLSGWAMVSESMANGGTKQIEGTEESTVITLNRDGDIKAAGRHKIVFEETSFVSPKNPQPPKAPR